MRIELELAGNPRGVYVTCEGKQTDLPLYGRLGTYGSKIPTPYKVKFRNRWRRVYCARYGNAGSLYIGKPGAWLATIFDICENNA